MDCCWVRLDRDVDADEPDGGRIQELDASSEVSGVAVPGLPGGFPGVEASAFGGGGGALVNCCAGPAAAAISLMLRALCGWTGALATVCIALRASLMPPSEGAVVDAAA